MYFWRIVGRHLAQVNPVSRSTSEAKRMKRLEMLVQKLRQKMILTYVILAASISAISRVWKSSSLLWVSHRSSLYVEPYVRLYLTKRFIKFERKIDDSDWVSWEYMNGSLSEDRGTK